MLKEELIGVQNGPADVFQGFDAAITRFLLLLLQLGELCLGIGNRLFGGLVEGLRDLFVGHRNAGAEFGNQVLLDFVAFSFFERHSGLSGRRG